MTREKKDLTEVARAIWSVLQWSEDKLDTELADLPTDHEVWKMASVAMMAMHRTDQLSAQEQDKEHAQPAAWQERQRIVGGEWGNWYIVPTGYAQLKGARTEVMNGSEYEHRPLYAAPQPNAALADGWMPIETAPRDGTPILGWSAEYGARETKSVTYTLGSPGFEQGLTDRWWNWDEPKNNWALKWEPTHWMRLQKPPAPPTLNASKDQS